MSRSALSHASGLSVRLVVQVERGKADPSLTDVARLSIGLQYSIAELVERVCAVKQRLGAN
jgi:transcriptional regulator with XRE-family HTH domain